VAVFHVSKIIGIDLGTTNSLVAMVESAIPLVIADADGRRLTPSVVHFPGPGAEPIVGRAALRSRILNPAETVYSVKRFMGRRLAEITPEERSVSYPLDGRADGPVTIPIHGRACTPEEISAAILKKLKADAEACLGEPVTRAVITVPAYFNDAQRNATIRAGELAGFTVERIVNEPTAAALAYGLDKLKEQSTIAVYDLGGGTFDLSILEMRNGVFQVLATNGNTRLGGDDIDRALVRHLISKIGDQIKPLKQYAAELGADAPVGVRCAQPVDPALLSILARLREAAEAAKIALSAQTRAEISLPFLSPDCSFHCTLERGELERLARDTIERTRAHCVQSLADAKVDAAKLDQVILVGGQTRMPLVRQCVAEWFGCAEFEESRGDLRIGSEHHKPSGPRLNTSQNPDEAVALGAAIQAEILSGGFQNVLLLDITPLSLGIETFGGLMNVIIPRNSTIPVKAGEMFTTAVDHQREMLIHVLQGERERALDNWSLGRFTLAFEPAPRGVPRVGVQFEIDANGILHVLARDIQSGRQTIVKIKSAVDVEDTAVRQMVDQSVEHAFSDMAARRWIEAKIKGDALIAATEKGLAACEGELDPDYRGHVGEALSRVVAALQAEDSVTGAGNLRELQSACAGLDEATRKLADLLMDRAIESRFRNQGLIR
jgi:molecular chaperone DnaK